MGRHLDGSTQWLELPVDPSPEGPQRYEWTAMIWFLPRSDPGIDSVVLHLGQAGTVNHAVWCNLDWSSAPNEAQLRARTTSSTTSILTGNGVNVGRWNCIVMRGFASNDRRLTLNGDLANSVTMTNTKTISQPTHLMIGAQNGAPPTLPFDGEVAFVALWDVPLLDIETQMLAFGANPQSIRRHRLKVFDRLGHRTPDIDQISNVPFVLTGSPGVMGDPPVRAFDHRFRPYLVSEPAAGGGLSIPVAMHGYRQRRAA